MKNIKLNLFLKKVNDRIDHILNKKNYSFSRFLSINYSKNGKRLRSRFVYDCLDKIDNTVITATACIELLHIAALMHDDILDKAPLRRGVGSFYAEKGIPQSVLGGDYVFCRSFFEINKIKDFTLRNIIITACSDMLAGELKQQSEIKNFKISVKKYIEILKLKTGSLFKACSGAGAYIKQLTSAQAIMACEAGAYAGVAYQIFDDINDYISTHKDKKPYSDIKCGIVTLPLIYLLNACSNDEKNKIYKIMHSSNIGKGEVCEILTIMDKYLCIEKSLEKAKAYIVKAQKCFIKAFDRKSSVINYIEEKIIETKKEYRNSRRRLCGN